MKKLRTLLTLFMVSLCSWQIAWATEYVAPEWSVIPFTLHLDDSEWSVNNDGTSISSPTIYGGETALTASLHAEKGVILKFEYDRYWYGELKVYVDDVLMKIVNATNGANKKEYSINIRRGEHTIKWLFVKNQSENAGYATLYNIGAVSQNITYMSPTWSEIPLDFEVAGNSWTVKGTEFLSEKISQNSDLKCTSLIGYFTNTEDASISYKLEASSSFDVDVYIDNELVYSLDAKTVDDGRFYPFFNLVQSGNHVIEWRFKFNSTNTNGLSAVVDQIGIYQTPQVSVNLFEPGSLGTEVLYFVEALKDVRNLKITGKMNSEDYSKLDMMNNLMILDLSDADIDDVPAKLCSNQSKYNSDSGDPKFTNLFKVVLPRKAKSIGEYAFASCRSLSEIFIPSSVESIGRCSFVETRIKKANLTNVVNIPSRAFSNCSMLETISFSPDLESVGPYAFNGCYSLDNGIIHFPVSLMTIGEDAFISCKKQNFRFPKKDLSIGREAFYGTAIDSLILNGDFGNGTWCAFHEMPQLVYAEFGVGTYSLNFWSLLSGCPVNTIKLKSTTVVNPTEIRSTMNLSNIKLIVPDYLVNSYKLHNFWYNAQEIVGFSTSEVKEWYIHQPLTMNNSRFEGEPDVYVQWSSASWKLNGDAPMDINNFYVDWCSPVVSNCDNIKINGTYTSCYQTTGKKWYFISLPFNFRVGDIQTKSGVKYAIRYYDGAHRAANGIGGSWKNYTANDVITAGTGFIYQTSADDYTFFYALNDASKQKVLSNAEIVIPLAANYSESAANRGWNLVGNPWHCYYNNHKLNFTAPITTWNGSTYVAYSIIDDDYAIKPNEAFFVQCPDEVTEISFPTDGRQLTSVIESQNASRRYGKSEHIRQLIDIEVACDNLKDKTRVVLNDEATLNYNAAEDAAKFFSMDNEVPQIYTVEADGNEYAINERPMDNGTVKLRLNIQKSDTYTIRALRNDLRNVVLRDLLTNTETDLSKDVYTIELEPGIYAERFELCFVGNAVTDIQKLQQDAAGENRNYFNLSGQQIVNPTQGVFITNGKKVIIK